MYSCLHCRLSAVYLIIAKACCASFLQDRDQICNEMRALAKTERVREFTDTEDYLWKFFVNRVWDNLHFVLCFSPVGNTFRSCARKFPGILSGCIINWFFPWPHTALLEVAHNLMQGFPLEAEARVAAGVGKLMASMHETMISVAEDYFQRFRRHVYATPKSYLSFVELYCRIYRDKHERIRSLADNVSGGLQKLEQVCVCVCVRARVCVVVVRAFHHAYGAAPCEQGVGGGDVLERLTTII